MHRRSFLGFMLAAPLVARASALGAGDLDAQRLEQLLSSENAAPIPGLPIGPATATAAKLFLGAPYEAYTLEVGAAETCIVNLQGLDCVTLMETALDLARNLLRNKRSFDDLVAEVGFTRYRAGKLAGYASRLHYTSDWIDDNVEKKVVENITAALGGEPFVKEMNFMSRHREAYKQLASDDAALARIRAVEAALNARQHFHVPKDRVAGVEARLRDGDVIAITTDLPGLDCSHVGLAVRDGARARFLHASSAKKQVIITDVPLAEYLASVRKHTGIMVARPLEPA